jgi:hypothetical protein
VNDVRACVQYNVLTICRQDRRSATDDGTGAVEANGYDVGRLSTSKFNARSDSEGVLCGAPTVARRCPHCPMVALFPLHTLPFRLSVPEKGFKPPWVLPIKRSVSPHH